MTTAAASRPALLLRGRRWRIQAHSLFLLPAALYLLILTVYPFVQLMQMSVSQVSTRNIFKSWQFIGLAGFKEVAATAAFQQAAVNTVIYVAIVVGVGLGGGLAAAVILWRGGRLSAVVLAIMVFSWALPPLINGTAWKFLLDGEGLPDDVLALFGVPRVYWLVQGHLPLISVALVNAWATVPFATLVYRAALLDISPEVLASAEVDGAGRRQVVRHIVLPLLQPVSMVLVVLFLLYAFKSFDFIYIMTAGGPGTISTTLPFLSYHLAFQLYEFTQGAATAVVTLLIVAVLAAVYLRQAAREERT